MMAIIQAPVSVGGVALYRCLSIIKLYARFVKDCMSCFGSTLWYFQYFWFKFFRFVLFFSL